jgi:hypothetical protein
MNILALLAALAFTRGGWGACSCCPQRWSGTEADEMASEAKGGG